MLELGDRFHIVQGLEYVELQRELTADLCHGLEGKLPGILEPVLR